MSMPKDKSELILSNNQAGTLTSYFNFEIYTINPETGEKGWNIIFLSVKAETMFEARCKLLVYPTYDCTILFNWQHWLDCQLDYIEFIPK